MTIQDMPELSLYEIYYGRFFCVQEEAYNIEVQWIHGLYPYLFDHSREALLRRHFSFILAGDFVPNLYSLATFKETFDVPILDYAEAEKDSWKSYRNYGVTLQLCDDMN